MLISKEATRTFTTATPSTTRTSGSRSRKATIALWTIQGLLACVFVFAGAAKLVMPAHTLTQSIDLPVLFLRFVTVCELLGALGLVLPGIFHTREWLTPVAAVCLVGIMVGAVVTTVVVQGVAPAAFPAVVGACLCAVAYRRRPVTLAA